VCSKLKSYTRHYRQFDRSPDWIKDNHEPVASNAHRRLCNARRLQQDACAHGYVHDATDAAAGSDHAVDSFDIVDDARSRHEFDFVDERAFLDQFDAVDRYQLLDEYTVVLGQHPAGGRRSGQYEFHAVEGQGHRQSAANAGQHAVEITLLQTKVMQW